jgi:hemerythrin
MTAYLHWDSSFSVGNELLDRQHQKLMGLCNELAHYSVGNQTISRSGFHDILNEMVLYAREHFETEEALLKELDYPGLASQEAEHFAYDEKIAEWSFNATVGDLDLSEAQSFLAAWWRNHILITDMQYRPLMQSMG